MVPRSIASNETSEDEFYAEDVEFRSGVVSNQSPVFLAYAAAINGFCPPVPSGAFTYADLGCGDGTTLCALAAANPEARFVGVDFNAAHIGRARETADNLGLKNVAFVETPFSELSAHELPAFDFVAMNGVYAWLAAETLAAVHDFVRGHLRRGGLFYVEYTTLPGKVSVLPLWHLIRTLVPSRGQPTRERASEAIELLGELGDMGFLAAHRPAAHAARNYITGAQHDPYMVDHFAHNALAGGFRPRYFTEMADEMRAVGLAYAGRTALALNDLTLSVPSKHVAYLRNLPDPSLRELVKDYIRNEQQRRDVFIMDSGRDPEAARAFLANEVRYLGKLPRRRIRRRVTLGKRHTISMTGPAYDTLIRAFDDGAASMGRIVDSSGDREPLMAAAWRLMASNQYFLCIAEALPAVDLADVSRIRIPLAINEHLLRQAKAVLAPVMLVSEVTGGPAVRLGPLETIMLTAAVDHDFSEAVDKAHEELRHETRGITTTRGPLPLSTIGKDKLAHALRRLRQQHLHGMLRLGIVEAVSEGW